MKSKRTLFIHIGWHKTASTLIQRYLHRYRAKLVDYDICYPVIDNQLEHGLIKHSDLLRSVFNALNPDRKLLKVRSFDELFDRSIEEIQSSNCRWAIISEEGLSETNPGIAGLMGRYRDHFDDIRIVAYLRRQDYFFEALYAQFVKQKLTRNTAYLDSYIQRPEVRKRADYAQILDWWAEVFGRDRILVAPFERQTIVPDPLTFFFRLTGLPEKVLEELPPARKEANVTPPREVTEFFRHMNLNRSDYAMKVLSEYLMQSGGAMTDTRYFCRADRERILEDYGASNERVAREYLQREDGILFAEPVEEYPNCRETWQGLEPPEVLRYALPLCGVMSREIVQLRSRIRALQNENTGRVAVRRMKKICRRALNRWQRTAKKPKST
ncbi:MAG: hypothetical protein WCZ10_12830 [Desulfobulbaceae bacterium]|jgi:hypothetical protein